MPHSVRALDHSPTTLCKSFLAGQIMAPAKSTLRIYALKQLFCHPGNEKSTLLGCFDQWRAIGNHFGIDTHSRLSRGFHAVGFKGYFDVPAKDISKIHRHPATERKPPTTPHDICPDIFRHECQCDPKCDPKSRSKGNSNHTTLTRR